MWYGWQTLSVDAASIALVVAQAATELTPTVLGVGGLATFLLGSPIVLLAHDSPWSMPSFLVRLASAGLMVGGAAIALGGGCFVVFGEEPAGCGTRQVVGGVMMLAGLFGVPAAIALDAMFARQARAQAHRPPPVSVWADPTHGALGLSVSVPQSL